MPIDFYYMICSAPCRTVMLTAKALGVELNLKELNLLKKEQLSEDFTKINPTHTIPTLVDEDGFAVWESRVISTYLVEKYGKDDTLYSKNPKDKAVVDQRLYFDATVLYQRFGEAYYPTFFGTGELKPENVEKLKEAVGFLNTFLEDQEYAAGKNLTVADLSLVATIATIEMTGFDLSAFPNVVRWYKKVQEIAPGYDEINRRGVENFQELLDELKKQSS